MKLARILCAALALLFVGLAQAAILTPQQITTLKATAAANPTAAALMASADDIGLAAWFNGDDPGACIVWRNDVSIAEANAAMVWTEVDGLTAGKARIWEWMHNLSVLDARQANIRQGLSDAFASATATKAALTALAKRTATRAEKALASGACTSGSPSIMTLVGRLSYADASLIRS